MLLEDKSKKRNQATYPFTQSQSRLAAIVLNLRRKFDKADYKSLIRMVMRFFFGYNGVEGGIMNHEYA